MTTRILLGALVLLSAMTGAALSEPKRVLLLHSFGPYFAPWSENARTIREELRRQSKEPVDIFEASLATARFSEDKEGPFVNYLSALFGQRHLDLVITIGSPAVSFFQRYREQLFPSVPAVHTGLDQQRVPTLTANDVAVSVANDLAVSVDNILRVLPETTNVAIVIGNSPIEKYWAQRMRAAFVPLEKRVSFTWFNELTFDEMLKRAAALPPRSAILFGLLLVDAAGVAHEEGTAFARLHSVANAPIFAPL